MPIHILPNGEVRTTGLHLDWNALMAAVTKKEDGNIHFQRRGGQWLVFRNVMPLYGESFIRSDPNSEARALALCIYAVANQIPSYAGQDSPPVQDGGEVPEQ